jgi:hypothetical protein
MAVDSEDAGIMTKLKKEVMDKLERMVSFEEAPDSFLASMVDHVKCYPDRTLEVALNILPTRWKYMLSRYSYSDKKEKQGPVSEPEPALLNNNVHRIASGPLETVCQLAASHIRFLLTSLYNCHYTVTSYPFMEHIIPDRVYFFLLQPPLHPFGYNYYFCYKTKNSTPLYMMSN